MAMWSGREHPWGWRLSHEDQGAPESREGKGPETEGRIWGGEEAAKLMPQTSVDWQGSEWQ